MGTAGETALTAPLDDGSAASFEPLRTALMRVAYQMLGSVADAEDIVQEAFLRWLRADRAVVRHPKSHLLRVVTHLALDHLKATRRQREVYVGPWLPEPVIDAGWDDGITLPLLLALERLSPLERAAFLLREMFDMDYAEIATTIGRDCAACRQLVARARKHVRAARPRFAIDARRGLALAEAFFEASRSGDARALAALLAEDVDLWTDGGGKRPASTEPLHGSAAVAQFFARLAVHFRDHPSRLVRTATVNGLPGLISREADGQLQTIALRIEAGLIAAIYVTRNPDKLRRVR